MEDKSRQCACGTAMAFRLGQFECPACGRLELQAVTAAADSRPAPGPSLASNNWDPGAQYRQAPTTPERAASPRAEAAPVRSSTSSASRAGSTGLKRWGWYLVFTGALGFVLPAMNIQFIVLSLFGPYEFVVAGAFVVVGLVLLAIPDGA